MNKPTISIIAAIDQNRGLGKDGKLPWNLPADLKHFKHITLNHPIIMGRKTFDSIGRPLPNRTNIVITRQDKKIEGVITANSLKEALDIASAKDQEEIFIIGGGQIYQQAINLADKLYLTLIEEIFPTDTHFPEYNQFNLVLKEKKGQENNLHYRFLELSKK